jgi:hypothetical protein
VTILQALADPKLFGGIFSGQSWATWRVLLAALFGLPLSAEDAAIFCRHTGRASIPTTQARELWCISGRRSGKSFVAALLAVFAAAFKRYAALLAPGEKATVAVIAADRQQARVVFRYVCGIVDRVPMLAKLVTSRSASAIELRGNVVIEVHTCSFRSTRGYSFAAVIADEAAFWRSCTSSKSSAPFGRLSKAHSRHVSRVMRRGDSPAFVARASPV